jgi:hypothetical protein
MPARRCQNMDFYRRALAVEHPRTWPSTPASPNPNPRSLLGDREGFAVTGGSRSTSVQPRRAAMATVELTLASHLANQAHR